MTKNKYILRHISCNMADFHADRHRFRFFYNQKEYIAECYGAVDIHFTEEAEREIPETDLCEIQNIIWNKIDKEEKNWRYPEKASEIADEYARENFR